MLNDTSGQLQIIKKPASFSDAGMIKRGNYPFLETLCAPFYLDLIMYRLFVIRTILNMIVAYIAKSYKKNMKNNKFVCDLAQNR